VANTGQLPPRAWAAKLASAEEEIRCLALGVIDPLNRAAADGIHYQPVTDVGEQALAMVEARS